MDFLDQVVMLAPDYAEGWNRRATLHFTMEQLFQVDGGHWPHAALEPRHFGALGGHGDRSSRTRPSEACDARL
jgi:hypothetical protein